ncbi:hypothetical protein RFI_16494 [Reticulomyxa filosa]|uniref:Uncharacterized protein n=1 Tax=Reticulomyxa filosa TaxID=46433 RepID=X6N4M9_RETFI|nr:hypothetical protein RFI_16494 [Reticulomyxa filosa]|eukprot:ETO20719.1 hypothetical protein RFI_16494 [Reticulomyxa filosa]
MCNASNTFEVLGNVTLKDAKGRKIICKYEQLRERKTNCCIIAKSCPKLRKLNYITQKKKSEMKKNGEFGQLTDVIRRSINLALSYRGICGLKMAGLLSGDKSTCVTKRKRFGNICYSTALFSPVLKLFPSSKKKKRYDDLVKQGQLILMQGRYIHDADGSVNAQPYGQEHEVLFIESFENVTIRFNCKIRRVTDEPAVVFTKLKSGAEAEGQTETIQAKFVVGADGGMPNKTTNKQELQNV